MITGTFFKRGFFPLILDRTHHASRGGSIYGWTKRDESSVRIEASCEDPFFARSPFHGFWLLSSLSTESGGESERNDEKMYGTFSEDLQPHFWGHATFQNAPKIPAADGFPVWCSWNARQWEICAKVMHIDSFYFWNNRSLPRFFAHFFLTGSLVYEEIDSSSTFIRDTIWAKFIILFTSPESIGSLSPLIPRHHSIFSLNHIILDLSPLPREVFPALHNI